MMKRKSDTGNGLNIFQQTPGKTDTKRRAEIFLTFSGNCRSALLHYQKCFGGTVSFQTFSRRLTELLTEPVICGSLISNTVIIHGSDLVADEGRIIGNCIAIYLKFNSRSQRKNLIDMLTERKKDLPETALSNKLVEITDAFGTRWILGT